MKRIFLLLLLQLPLTGPLLARQTQKVTSKRKTTVDSVNTPPRMDGNTGQYDTVRQLQRKTRKKGRGNVYEYNIQSDTVIIRSGK